MELSKRLGIIASFIENGDSMVDIGTDHGYIPIYLVKKGICNKAIAGDINKGPIERAEKNIFKERLSDKIICRLGGGFSVVSEGEVDACVIAGMGGDLITEIIENDIEKFKNLKYAVIQPVQNVDVFRKNLYNKGFEILNEKMCIEDGKFYEIFKIKYDTHKKKVDPIYYEISEKLFKEKDLILKEYIIFLINKYENILKYIIEDTDNAIKRRKELNIKLSKLRSCLNDFNR
ncbi:SAM-dependent methyltransferase [Clostridiaceae bacterium 14S0207]|nr:SAM-dependent methyltransferase [Clostridiaceae bacterium 14S0207]